MIGDPVPQSEQSGLNPGSSAIPFAVDRLVNRLRQRALECRMWRQMDYGAGESLFEQGEADDRLWVLESGLIKLGYLTADGEYWIKSFIADCGLFTGSGDLAPSGTNRYGATSLEPSVVATVPLDWLVQQLAQDSMLRADFAQFGAWLQTRKQRREQALLCLVAEQRYRAFLADQPLLASRLRQADIARYIGITAIALSRIRRRLGLSTRR